MPIRPNPICLLTNPSVNESKFILMRHLKTLFNEGHHKAILSKDVNKIYSIRFNNSYVDTEITPNAVEEMKRANELTNVNVEKIYVSPMKRTLLTCLESIKLLEKSNKQKEPPIVEINPFLFEKIEDSSDLNNNLNTKKENFSTFVFRNKKYPINWDKMTSVFNNNDYLYYQLRFCDQILDDKLANNKIAKYDIENELKNNIITNNFYNYVLSKAKNMSDEDLSEEINNNIIPNVIHEMKRLAEYDNDAFIESFDSVSYRLKQVTKDIQKCYPNPQNNIDNKVLIIGHSVLFQYWCTQSIKKDSFDPHIDRERLYNCELVGVNFNYNCLL